MERNEIIDALKEKKENKVYKGLIIRNVTLAEKVDEYQRVSITLDKEVEQCVLNKETDKIEKRMSNVIFTSTISIIAILKESGAAFATNHIQGHLSALNPLLCDAKIDIIQEFVKDGADYKNPFSSKDNTHRFQGDRYITHIIKLDMCDDAKADLKDLRRAMYGI